MLKLFITIAIIYFIYRYFIATPALDRRPPQDELRQDHSQRSDQQKEGEYVDYEEVDDDQ